MAQEVTEVTAAAVDKAITRSPLLVAQPGLLYDGENDLRGKMA